MRLKLEAKSQLHTRSTSLTVSEQPCRACSRSIETLLGQDTLQGQCQKITTACHSQTGDVTVPKTLQRLDQRLGTLPQAFKLNSEICIRQHQLVASF